MIEHGLYILKSEFYELVRSLGGDCDDDGGGKRPVYCCLKDAKVEGLFWAIPTSDISHRSEGQVKRYSELMALGQKDLRSCYYHRAKTTVDAIYKVSSCLPIIEKYVSHPFTTHKTVHVVLQKKDDVSEIERKLKRILAFEFRRRNYFSQRISDVMERMMVELKDGDCVCKSEVQTK